MAIRLPAPASRNPPASLPQSSLLPPPRHPRPSAPPASLRRLPDTPALRLLPHSPSPLPRPPTAGCPLPFAAYSGCPKGAHGCPSDARTQFFPPCWHSATPRGLLLITSGKRLVQAGSMQPLQGAASGRYAPTRRLYPCGGCPPAFSSLSPASIRQPAQVAPRQHPPTSPRPLPRPPTAGCPLPFAPFGRCPEGA